MERLAANKQRVGPIPSYTRAHLPSPSELPAETLECCSFLSQLPLTFPTGHWPYASVPMA